jgi:hypothetical protein
MIQVVDDAESTSVAEKPMAKPTEGNVRSEATDLRCLSLCIGMLERVNSVRMISFAVDNRTEALNFRRSKKIQPLRASFENLSCRPFRARNSFCERKV